MEAGLRRALGPGALGALLAEAPPPGPGPSAAAAAAAAGGGPAAGRFGAEQAEQLLNDLWELVDGNFLDARGGGFDREGLRGLRDQALARKPRTRAEAYGAARSLLAQSIPGTDAYTRFLSPEEFERLAKYDISGVGLNVGTADEFEAKVRPLPKALREGPRVSGLHVLGLVRGEAAERAGLAQGDMLLEVDGERLEGRTPFEAMALLSGSEGGRGGAGPAGSTAQVTVVTEASGELKSVDLLRPERSPARSPVEAKLQGGGLLSVGSGGSRGYIRLSEFNSRAKDEVAEAVGRLQDAGAQELLLDLRGNPGGLVKEAIEIAGLFVGDERPVVQVANRRSAEPEVQRTSPSARPITDLPLTVLVDGRSASASEVLAGALRDNCRAVLAGLGNSFGKGLIQSVYEFDDGSGLVLTVGKYLTPSGTDIDQEGLHPEFLVAPGLAEVEKSLGTCQAPP